MKITDLQIVKNTLSLFGFDEDTTATKAKKQIKEKIEQGEIKVDSLSEEQAQEMLKYLSDLKLEALEQKDTLTIEEMETNKKTLTMTASIFDQIAISNYNFATASMTADKKRAKLVVGSIEELSKVYDAEIAAKAAAEEAERLTFARNWFAEEIHKYDLYDFAANWNIYEHDALKLKTSYNYSKEGQISSLKKGAKDAITNKLAQFQTDKTVIENNESKGTLFDYYVKSNYNLQDALDNLQEFKHLKLEEEERAKARAAAEEAERKRIQEQIAEEQRKAEAAKFEEAQQITEDADIVNKTEETETVVTTETETPFEELSPKDKIKKLESLIFFEEMAEKSDQAKINEYRKQIANLIVANSKQTELKIENTKKYKLRTFEIPETKLGQILANAGVETKASVIYEVEIESERSEGFEKWLAENNIEIVEG